MRKVKIFERVINPKTGYPTGEKKEVGIGAFHQWGFTYEEFESGPGNYSVAIVERQDGKVEMVEADLIQFLS